MKNGLLTGLLIVLFLSAKAQEVGIKVLLDSAKSVWYVDFDRTDNLAKQAERKFNIRGPSGNIADLINLYNLRIQSCNAFSRLQLWRQYVTELDEYLANNKNSLRPEEYKLFSLQNELSWAQYYDGISDHEKALEIFAMLLSEYEGLPRSVEVCSKLHVISNEIAQIHFQNGEYEASIYQHLASIPYIECASSGTGALSFSLTYRNVGTAYLRKEDFKQAVKYLKLAEDSLQKPLKQDPIGIARIALSLYETLASYYERIGNYNSAMLSMQKAIPLLKLRNVDDSFKGRISLGLGDLYFRKGELKQAQSHYAEAQKYFLSSLSDQPINLSHVYLSEVELFEKMGKINQAMEYCGKVIDKLVLNFKPDTDGNPALIGLLSKKQVFKVLQKKSRLLEKLFGENKDINVLTRAFHTNQLSLALLDSTANEVSLDKDKVNLAEESYSAFEDGIRMAYELYQQSNDKKYLVDCFSLIDKSKGIVLLDKLRQVDRFAGINLELVNREKEIKSELFLTEQDLYEQEIKNQKPAELATARERYASLKRDYADLMNKIKSEAPEYYRLRFDRDVIEAEDIQNKLLQKGEAMLEYFVGDSIIAVAGFTKSNQCVRVKKLPNDFASKVTKIRTLITNGDERENNADFEKIASELYDFLIKDVLQELGPEITSLTIIPDGVLGYLPFEVLRKNAGGEAYLTEDFSIRYAYSATYLNEQRQKKASQADHFFAGFVASNDRAAISYDRSSKVKFSSLPGAEKEVKAITELLGSNFSIFSPARKSDFKEHASDYKILHLAMHSLVNDENPMMSVMVFSSADDDTTDVNELTAIELYNMSLKSDLAVLSACNTGFGTLHRGEGIMSFSRAFSYAGVPSAVISLWQVPDKATSKIMVNFYKYLKAGESKDLALQHAKLDFIRDHPQMSAPFYWAGFILTGSKEPLKFPSSYLWYWIIAGFLIAISVLIVARRFKKDTLPSR